MCGGGSLGTARRRRVPPSHSPAHLPFSSFLSSLVFPLFPLNAFLVLPSSLPVFCLCPPLIRFQSRGSFCFSFYERVRLSFRDILVFLFFARGRSFLWLPFLGKVLPAPLSLLSPVLLCNPLLFVSLQLYFLCLRGENRLVAHLESRGR